MVAALDGEDGILGQQVAGLGDAAITCEHVSGEDQRLCAGTAFGEAPGHEQEVGANFGHCKILTSMG